MRRFNEIHDGGDRRFNRGERGGPGFGPGFGFGPGPGGAGPGFGPGGRGHGRFGGWGGGGRMRRGDVRTAVLAVLVDQDAHGYQIIQELESRSAGAWRPSPGSVYPVLQMLQDAGLVTSTEADGKRVYSITDSGREEATKRIEEAGGAPWENAAAPSGGLREQAGLLAAAAWQVGAAGTPAQVEQATALLVDARKRLYGLLAEP